MNTKVNKNLSLTVLLLGILVLGFTLWLDYETAVYFLINLILSLLIFSAAFYFLKKRNSEVAPSTLYVIAIHSSIGITLCNVQVAISFLTGILICAFAIYLLHKTLGSNYKKSISFLLFFGISYIALATILMGLIVNISGKS